MIVSLICFFVNLHSQIASCEPKFAATISTKRKQSKQLWKKQLNLIVT